MSKFENHCFRNKRTLENKKSRGIYKTRRNYVKEGN